MSTILRSRVDVMRCRVADVSCLFTQKRCYADLALARTCILHVLKCGLDVAFYGR